MQRKHTNAPFREARAVHFYADLQHCEIKKNIRDIVQAYYDFDLPDSEQTDVHGQRLRWGITWIIRRTYRRRSDPPNIALQEYAQLY